MKRDSYNNHRGPDIGDLVPGFHFYYKIGESASSNGDRLFTRAGRWISGMRRRKSPAQSTDTDKE